MPTSTEKNDNTSPTAASAGRPQRRAAVDACRQIRARLAGFAADLFADPASRPSRVARQTFASSGNAVYDARAPAAKRIAFGELWRTARGGRVDLGARGFFATPGVDFNRETGRGTPFFYYTQGAASPR